MTDILLAEDQELVRQGLKLMIEMDETLKITGEANDGDEAIALCKKNVYDLVILDIRMPVMTGLEAAKIIRERWPDVFVLMLTTFNDEEYALEALKHGANGYLLKNGEAEDLIRSIHSVLEGGLAIEDQVAAKVMPKLLSRQSETIEVDDVLTNRELDIISSIGQGLNNNEIAKKHFLSIGTVKNYISTILDKLELRDRTQIAIYALERKIKR